MKIVVESGIPIPPSYTPKTYPIEGMKIGDSFFVPPGEPHKHPSMWSGPVATALYHQGKKLGMKFKTKPVENGVRCWRIS